MKKMYINQLNMKLLALKLSIAAAVCAQVVFAQGLKIPGLGSSSGALNSPSAPPSITPSSSKAGLRTAPAQGTKSLSGADAQTEVGAPNLLLTASENDKEYSDYIVAIVDSEPITNREVNLRASERLEQMRSQGVMPPSKESVLSKILEELIIEKAALQLALETGITVSDEELLQSLNVIAERNSLTLDQLISQIKTQGQNVDLYKVRLRQQMILQKLRERDVISRVKISDLEADKYLLDQQKKGASTVQLLNVSQILVSIPDGVAEAQLEPFKAKANEILRKAKAGEDFAELARSTSESADSKNGGSMGLRAESRYPALFLNALKGVKPGQVTGPVRSGAGFHILKLIERQQVDSESVMVTQTHARHILLRPGGQLSQNAARAQLADFKRRIERGEADFAKLAKENSQDASANSGGDLGWAVPGQFVPEFEAAMSKLSAGQIADPLVSRFGVHLIQVIERKQAPISEKEKRENAKKQMQEKKFEESYAVWERELRGHACVEYRDPPM